MIHEVDQDTIEANALSNYCAHKRLFEQIEKSTSADYFLIFEDDAQLQPYFRHDVEDFIQKYDYPWSVVQIDPHGVRNPKALLKELPLQYISPRTNESQIISHPGMASGIQALLVKK